MAAFAFTLPILPGKEEADAQTFERFATTEADAFDEFNRAHGVRRHAVWQQKTPGGTFAIVFLEADDIGAAIGGFASAQSPIAQAFRDSVMDVHGVDLANDPPPEVVPLIDWKA